ncbi:MAG: nitroreductase family protein [Thermoplasmata archaeon]|nr:nitroreductase family protein [Thermoplasmata archaeon]
MSDTETLSTMIRPTAVPEGSQTLLSRVRPVEAEVNPMFVERWSPRAFSDEPIPAETVRTLFEAARWAPSSANEQPWLFVYAVSPEDRARFAQGLAPMNRVWAERAPVLAFLFARSRFDQDGPFHGHANPTASFDAGAAWMSLALQAHLVGLSTHAMGGIEREEVHRLLGVPTTEFSAVIGIAIGHRAEPVALPEPYAAREGPSPRRPLSEMAQEGHFSASRKN